MRHPHYVQVGSRSSRQAGFSLLELSVVVLILGIMALVVIPDSTPTGQQKLDLAAQSIAAAMRYARAEAMRTGNPTGFRQNSGSKRIRVFRVDTGTVPWTPLYDIYHPVSKKIYDIKLRDNAATSVISVTSSRDFRGSCNTGRNVYFDRRGSARCLDPETVLVNRYDVTLTLGDSSRTVSLTGIDGQVGIQ